MCKLNLELGDKYCTLILVKKLIFFYISLFLLISQLLVSMNIPKRSSSLPGLIKKKRVVIPIRTTSLNRSMELAINDITTRYISRGKLYITNL